MLECVGLTKQYGRLYALHDLSCGLIRAGSVISNGAGSTTMNTFLYGDFRNTHMIYANCSLAPISSAGRSASGLRSIHARQRILLSVQGEGTAFRG